MFILSVNAGSSSLKFSLFNMKDESVLVNGVFEKIGMNDSFYTIKLNGEKIKKEIAMANHDIAVSILLKELVELNIVSDINDIKAVSHRVVHGGDIYDKSVIVTDEVITNIEELCPLAPLHNPANLTGINTFRNTLKDAVMVACFDTAFHQTISEEEFVYPIPYEYYQDYKVRRYGFHGISHNYISNRITSILNNSNSKIISCHIGNGASVTAIKNSKSIATSMGFTPNAGLMMGTRCGDVDVNIVPYLMTKLNKTADEICDILNKKSGLLGVSSLSSDHRDIEDGIKANNERCILANNMLVDRIVNYISMYNTLLEGADVITFTAGLGENACELREEVINKLNCLGIYIDKNRNNIRGKEALISTDDSKVQCYVIPTNEELMMARDAYSLINK